MRFHLLLSALCACLIACGGSSSGKIDITTTSTLDAAQSEQISQFVFVVSNPSAPGSGSVLYPSACLSSCEKSQEGCPVSKVCFSKTTCGFSAEKAVFDPSIAFDQFEKDSIISVRLCGLDNNGQIIGSGVNQFANSDGASASITLSSSNECGGLPTPCP